MVILLRITVFFFSYLATFVVTAAVSNWVDISIENGHVKMPVTLAGRAGMAILDSGAQVNGINEGFVQAHALQLVRSAPVEIIGVYGRAKRDTYSQVTVGLFGANLVFNDMVESYLGKNENAVILGAGFLARFIFQIDYPNNRMRIMSRDAIDLAALSNIESARQQGSGRPIIKVSLNEQENVWLLLDTGNSGGILIERYIAKGHQWLEQYPVSTELSAGVNALVYNEAFSLPSMKVGPFDLENVTVSVPAEGQKSNISSQYEKSFSRIKGRKIEGIVGYDVLKHFIVTFDYVSGNVHLALPEA